MRNVPLRMLGVLAIFAALYGACWSLRQPIFNRLDFAVPYLALAVASHFQLQKLKASKVVWVMLSALAGHAAAACIYVTHLLLFYPASVRLAEDVGYGMALSNWLLIFPLTSLAFVLLPVSSLIANFLIPAGRVEKPVSEGNG